MNSQREYGIAIILWLISMVIIMMVVMLSGCKGREAITETVYVHDTVRVNKTDTVRDVRVVTQRDSTHHETERIITLKESGDTLRIITNNIIERIVQRTDSIDRYRHIADSLRQSLIQEQQKNKVVTKSGTSLIDKLVIIAIFIIVCAFLAKFVFKRR